MWKKGDKVILTSTRYIPNKGNPYYIEYPEVTGTVYDMSINSFGNMIIRVRWSNGRKNSYSPDDLAPAGKYQTQKRKLNV